MIKSFFFLAKNIMYIPINFIKKNSIDLTVRLSSNVLVAKTKIGMNSYVGCNVVMINADIGNYCSIAPGVQIGGMEHSYWWLSTSTFLSDKCSYNKRVKIGNDVWIGASSVVKQGIKIGNGSVIGAMSFVNKDVPPNSIVFGHPAKIYKKRFDDELFEKLQKTKFWMYNAEEAKIILRNFEQKNGME
jgi:acetyltransferase-like isoleucine patch superfamily enzyme